MRDRVGGLGLGSVSGLVLGVGGLRRVRVRIGTRGWGLGIRGRISTRRDEGEGESNGQDGVRARGV